MTRQLPADIFVGRDAERRRFRYELAAVASALSGDRRLAHYCGEHGVGKSALTQMAHVGAHLTRVGEDAYDLSVFRGFAESFWEWISEQAEEFGYQVT